jgi:amidase
MNPDAIAIAQALDAERASGTIRSPLHGLPMIVKDSIATMDKMNNTAGSYALLGATVPRDSFVVAKLKAAGVIILGKSSMSEWANFRSLNIPAGWSARAGQVIGAYCPNQDPNGSSSGSAVGSSIGLSFAFLGTDTVGSILAPASWGNLVGIRPTVGLTSRSLVIPISEHQDTIGPLARTVADVAAILSIMAGKDVNDTYTNAQPFATPPDYTAALKYNALRGKRIGVPRNTFKWMGSENIDKPIQDAFEDSLDVLRQAGAIIVENTNLTAFDAIWADSLSTASIANVFLAADFLVDLPAYLAQLTSNPNNITNLTDLTAFLKSFPLEGYPNRDTAAFDLVLGLGFDNTSPIFAQLLAQVTYWGTVGGLTGALATYQLDAMVAPTMHTWKVAPLAGTPIITVPMGKYPRNTQVVAWPYGLNYVAPNVPFGISFMGDKWTEEALIGFAYAYEQRTMVRRRVRPVVKPTTQLRDVVNH